MKQTLLMKITNFNYDLPESLIAQTPIDKRDESRLMVVDKTTGKITHKKFHNIIDYLNKNDVLVINNTKVLPSRLIGEKEVTKAKIELLLLKEIDNCIWECLARPVKRLHIGTIVTFGNGILKAEVIEILSDGLINIRFIYQGLLLEILETLGEMPLPPYIHAKLKDKDRYQTVYAQVTGSAAAPTAGLHFTKDLLKKIKTKGIKICEVTLHVGLGTFRPVQVDDIKEHKMHSEFYSLDETNANTLNKAKQNGNKIFAVGTTCVRTLETILQNSNEFYATSGYTNIFIYPGYEFKAVDALITNFHLPKSTLLMLVSAFADREKIMAAYTEAIEKEYKFFSFGDAMLITSCREDGKNE